METLALTHSYIAHEEPVPELTLPSLDELGLRIPSSAWVGLAAIAVAASVFTLPGEAHAAYVSTNGSRLNVRSGPGLEYCVLRKLHNGSHVRTTKHSVNGWVKLKQGGWVASQWLNRGYVAAAPSYNACGRCIR